jgi:hypothetical protein
VIAVNPTEAGEHALSAHGGGGRTDPVDELNPR